MKKKHNHRLVLGCVILAIELVRLAGKILVLVNATIYYKQHGPEVVQEISA
jgi:hypothetical protein